MIADVGRRDQAHPIGKVRVTTSAIPEGAANPPRFEVGQTSMVTAGRVGFTGQTAAALDAMAACARACCRSAIRGMRLGVEGSGSRYMPVRKLVSLAAISCAIAVAGCASHSAQRENQAEPILAAEPSQETYQPSYQPRIRRPARALLTPQPAPDCEFKRSDLKTVDPDQWARLKLDYERQCYQRAEKVARNRLQLLQASSMCEIEPGRQSLLR